MPVRACQPRSYTPASTALVLPVPGQVGLLAAAIKLNATRCGESWKLSTQVLYITEASLPSMSLFQPVHCQAQNKAWEWMPWRRKRASSDIRGKRSASSRDGALDLFMSCAELREEETEQELSVSLYRLQSVPVDSQGSRICHMLCVGLVTLVPGPVTPPG